MLKIPLPEGIRYNELMMSDASAKPLPGPEKTLRVLLAWVTTLLVLGAAGLLVYYFYALVSLLVAVLIVTYILLGPVNLVEKGIRALTKGLRKVPGYERWIGNVLPANPRVFAVLLVYLLLMLTLVWSGGKLVPVLGRQLGEMSTRINVQLVEISDDVIDWADSHIGNGVFRDLFYSEIEQAEKQGQVRQHSESGKPVTLEEKRVIHQSLLNKTAVQMENLITSALPNFINFVGGTLNGLLFFLVGALLTFYFLVDGYKLRQEWLYLFPKPARYTANTLLASFHQVMFAFIKGQVMLGMLTGAYMFAIYSIFQVPYAFLLGSIFALAELLPVVGTWIGIIIGLTVILLNMPPIVALWVWLCSYCFQTVKDNILAPKVVGDVMGLHPMVIILALLICAKIAGLLGVLVALPLASIVNVVIRMLLQRDGTKKSPPEQNHA